MDRMRKVTFRSEPAKGASAVLQSSAGHRHALEVRPTSRFSAQVVVGRPRWISSCDREPRVSRSAGEDDPEQRIERVLEEGLERVETPRAARAVVARVERLSAGRTEEERAPPAAQR